MGTVFSTFEDLDATALDLVFGVFAGRTLAEVAFPLTAVVFVFAEEVDFFLATAAGFFLATGAFLAFDSFDGVFFFVFYKLFSNMFGRNNKSKLSIMINNWYIGIMFTSI